MGAAAPRFRRDLHAAEVEAEGVLYVEVKDTRSGKSFRFYDFEYAVARSLNGRPLAEVARDLHSELQLELSPEQLEAFSDQLRSLGFLEADSAENFFPPLVDDESGEFEMPNFAAAPGPPAAVTPAPVTPPPVTPPPVSLRFDAGKTPTPGPAAAARSLTENTITSFPPEVDPARPAPAAATPATPAPLPKPPLDPLGAGPFAPATTPAPLLTNGAGAPSPGSNGSPAGATASRASDSTTELRSAELEELLAESDEDDEHTPIADTRPRRTDEDEAAVLMGKTATGDEIGKLPGGQPSGQGAPGGQSVKERRELPTQRLRAVTDELAEEPGPRRTPGRPTPAVDADVDDDDDEELESAPSVASTAPTAAMGRLATGGGLTPAATGGRQAWVAYAALGAAAAAIIAAMVYKYLANPEAPAITVSAMVPTPTTVYRMWETTAKVDRVEAPAFSFSGDGKVAEIAAAGTRYGAGDVLALLEGGKKFRADLAHNRERLGYYEQLRDSMNQQNNKPEVRQAELKIAEKKRLIAEAQAALSKQAIIAGAPGEVGETLVQVGATVKAGDPAMKAKGTGYRASFELTREQAEKARQLGFCRVQIDEKPMDCNLAAEGGDETHVVIDLPNDPVVGTGKTVSLARDRMDAVFSVPASALLKMGDSDRLFVVTPTNRAELRVVAVAERAGNEAIITQGLDVGDRVIVDSPPDLKPDARVLIRETVAK